MSARSVLLIAAALLMAAGTFFVMKSWLAGQRAKPVVQVVEEKVETEVLVARADMPAGIFVGEQHLRWQSWPDDDLPDSYLVKGEFDEEKFYGAVVRRGMPAGTPILITTMVHPGERGFLSAVLRPGYRAFSIKVSAASSISGLVFPGDRVDVILVHRFKIDPEDDNSPEQRASETILADVRVLALDQTIDDQDGEPSIAKTATLEVTPKQAEVLAVSDDLGRITLSLRSLAKDEKELRRIIESGAPLEEPTPRRARTYTRDAEASVLVGYGGGGPKVAVSRGSKVVKERAK